ncbi:MAG TPA: hypothetical protein PLG34_04150 [Spirochaetota bacterium]|jgi:hypothetical protein|nr:MAG: hypothetical protein BWX91_00547 [Spirochaetes bacterium ADurb.Bin133]HNZ27841.1 hypothetical protein [Spirochaetota bacterium]HPY87155.1 hypothetical protein [Spirochaetota bacterium]HQB60477.1 hypothetical protein [Spirochaetota bacterium]
MKKLNAFLSLAVIIAMLSVGCTSGGETKKKASEADPRVGFEVKGDKVIFSLHTAVYGGQILDEIESVTVAGEFNGWDTAAADWQASDDDGDGIWTLEKTLAEAPCGSKFKFVVNQVDWMQPPTEIDKKYLTDDGFGGFNLVLACE